MEFAKIIIAYSLCALKDGILDKARESGKKQLTEMFKAFGFKEVYVDIE